MTCSACWVSFSTTSSPCFTAVFSPLIFCTMIFSRSAISSFKLDASLCFTRAKGIGLFLLRCNVSCTTSLRDSYTLLMCPPDILGEKNSHSCSSEFQILSLLAHANWEQPLCQNRTAISCCTNCVFSNSEISATIQNGTEVLKVDNFGHSNKRGLDRRE